MRQVCPGNCRQRASAGIEVVPSTSAGDHCLEHILAETIGVAACLPSRTQKQSSPGSSVFLPQSTASRWGGSQVGTIAVRSVTSPSFRGAGLDLM